MKRIIFMIFVSSYLLNAQDTEIFLTIQNEINLINNIAQEQINNYEQELNNIEDDEILYNFWLKILVEDLNEYKLIMNSCKKSIIDIQNEHNLLKAKIALQILRNKIYALYGDDVVLKQIGIKKRSESLSKTFYQYSMPLIDILVKLSTITNASYSFYKFYAVNK